MTESDGCIYHAAQQAVERLQGSDDLYRSIQAMDTRRLAASGCRLCNPMLDVCTNACETPTKERPQTTLTRSAAAGRPTKIVKSADELRGNELSPCHAANASRDLQRVQTAVATRNMHGLDSTTLRQFHSAKEQETIANNGCRRCNPYLTRCTNENCAIPTADVQRQKGYAR